jgi:hypothetical protein
MTMILVSGILSLLGVPSPGVWPQDWLDAPRVVLPDGPEQIRRGADFDGDGDLDLLVVESDVNFNVHSFYVLFQETGDLVPGPTTVVPQEPDVFPGQALLEVADLTRDGLPDLVMEVRDYATNVHGLRLYPGTGSGSFGAPVFVPTDAFVWDGLIADGDGDGSMELALELVVPSPTILFVVGWWRWNGSTLAPRPHAAVRRYADDFAAADLDGDGRSELLLAEDEGPEVDLYSTLPGGQPELVTTFVLGTGPGQRVLDTGDLEGDGDVDVLAQWAWQSHQGIVLSNEGGVLVPGAVQPLAFPPGTGTLESGSLVDWDLDGDLDFLSHWEGLAVLENRRGVFSPAVGMRVASYGDSTYEFFAGVTGDVTGDGRPDFAADRFVYASSARLDGVGRVPDFLADVGAQDFDHDGDLDVINFFSSSYSNLLENDAQGVFSAIPLALPSAPPGHFYAGDTPPADLDGDGHGDLLRVLRVDDYPSNPVVETHLMPGSALGTFTSARPAGGAGLSIEPNVSTNTTADLDSDGDQDVLTFDGYWENDGTGFFGSRHAGWAGSPMRTADVDGDGDLDVLVLSYAGTLSLARNQGGSFTLELLTASSPGSEPWLGDLDGDGDLDLGIGTIGGGAAVLLYENVGGSFVFVHRLDQSQAVNHRLAFEDFDGDGRTDVLAMPDHGVSIEWYLWRQTGALWHFEAPVRYLGDHTRLSGDFDSDGDRDYFGYRLVRSRRFDGPGAGRIRQEGRGHAAAEPVAPLLGAQGPLRPGSPSATLRVTRARGGAAGVLLFSNRALVPGPIGRARLADSTVPALSFVLSGTSGVSGDGTFETSLGPATLALQGQRVWMQVLVNDTMLPRRFTSITNALELTFGL